MEISPMIAAEIGTSAAKLIEAIAIVRSHDRSLSSELRVFIAKYFADQSPRYGFFDPDSRFAFRVVDDRPRRKAHHGLHMIDLGGDVTGNGIGKLLFTILAAVAGNERDRIRERIRDVKRHLASQGVYGGGKRPFGYDVADKRLVPNPKEQEALARMRARRAEGKTYREIAFQVATEFGITLAPMTIKRILGR
jgi:hypothetical protein